MHGNILQNVKAHAPLPAAAHVDHGVGVEITQNHRNRAAGSGCMARLVLLEKLLSLDSGPEKSA
jgi:hypothetical protein